MLKMKILLKPLVGARFVADRVTTTNNSILALSFSLDERQNYVKIVTSLESCDFRRSKGLNNNIL